MSDKNATERLRADEDGIARAAQLLRNGRLVALPTETVYGLAARADDDGAVAAIYAAKGRPSFNPLIVHIASVAQAQSLAIVPPGTDEVIRAAWPGAVTLVLPKRPDAALADAVTAGLDTVALRMPDHPIMRAIIERCETPLAAPSANRSNAISPTCADHVLHTLNGRIDAVLDGGPTLKGLESTILAIRHDGSWDELRSGPVDCERLHRELFDRPMMRGDAPQTIEAPGQMARHYFPGKPMRLNAATIKPDEFAIGFGKFAGDVCLSQDGDLMEAASDLYAALHQAAASDKPRIAVVSIPETGIGKAINDRLQRAAA